MTHVMLLRIYRHVIQWGIQLEESRRRRMWGGFSQLAALEKKRKRNRTDAMDSHIYCLSFNF